MLYFFFLPLPLPLPFFCKACELMHKTDVRMKKTDVSKKDVSKTDVRSNFSDSSIHGAERWHMRCCNTLHMPTRQRKCLSLVLRTFFHTSHTHWRQGKRERDRERPLGT